MGRAQDRVEESELGAGTLFSSGLIAGGSIAGILFAILVGTGAIDPFAAVGTAFPYFRGETALAEVASTVLFLALALIVARVGMRKVQ